MACDFMRAGLKQAGAPLDLIQSIEAPSIPRSQELMRQVDLVLATGGGAMVKSAYSSGTPAYGVGAGTQAIEDAGLEVTEENCKRIGVAIGSGIGGIIPIAAGRIYCGVFLHHTLDRLTRRSSAFASHSASRLPGPSR